MSPKKIAAFAIGPAGAAILSLISLPVIAWFFSQEDVGRIAMLQVVLGFSLQLFSLGLDQAYVREFHEVDNTPALLKQALLPGLVLLFITILALLSFGGTLSLWMFGVPEWWLSALVASALVASHFSRFLSLVLRMNERGLAFSMCQLLQKLFLLVMIGSYIVTNANKNLFNLVFANVAAITCACVVFGWNTRVEWASAIHSKLDFFRIKNMLQYGMPLILGGLAFWGLTALDRLFLRMLGSFEDLAVYSVSLSFAAAASVLQNIFSTVWAPTVYKWASEGSGLESVNKVSRYILALVVLIFCLAGLLSWLIPLLLPVDYASVQWLVVSCIGYPLLYTLSETTVVGIGISRRTSYAMLAAIGAFCINLIGNWWLVPIFGASGAAVSTCFSFWFFFFLRTELSIYVWKPMPRILLYVLTLTCVVGAIVFTLWGRFFGDFMFAFWGVVLCVSGYIFRNEGREVFAFLFLKT